jgi:hypothetical protein
MKNKNPYQEALRYIDNAENTLKLAGKEGKYYSDDKYVRTACGTAYSGTLIALDALFDYKQVPKRRGRKAIEYYQDNLSKIDKKLLKVLNTTYRILHLEGYYEGETKIGVIKEGFECASSIIESIKPFSTNGVGKELTNS